MCHVATHAPLLYLSVRHGLIQFQHLPFSNLEGSTQLLHHQEFTYSKQIQTKLENFKFCSTYPKVLFKFHPSNLYKKLNK
ncbi:hypothetical protein P8452_58886 [Trifolium repens]|nr:hypothetical protein P8452_58886 [Trifolium repens]